MQSHLSNSVTLQSVGSLTPNPRNPNHHGEDQIERLAKILRYQGWRHPIIVSTRSNLIVAGHGRLLAAKKLGLETVPVLYQDFEDEDAEYAFLVSDNAIADWAELDLSAINKELENLGPIDIDLLGIKDFVVDMAENEEAQGDEDAIPRAPIAAKSKLGELWTLGNHRLLCGDCTVKENVERLMSGEKADMVFTSPPYADLREYGGGLDLDPKTLAKLFDWPASIFAVNLGLIIRNREIIPYWDAYLSEAKARGLKLLSWNVWDKGNASAPAHQQAMFGLCHEWIFVFGEYRELNLTKPNKLFGEESWGEATVREKDGSQHVHSRAGKIRSHRQLDSTIRLDGQKNYSSDYVGHPAQFPVALPEEYVKAATDDEGIVGDPFLGSGSTLIACEKTGRRCFGCEIDPHYVDVIVARWAKYTGKDPVREDGVKWSELSGTVE